VLAGLSSSTTPSWTEKDHRIPVRRGAQINVRLYTPTAKSSNGHALFIMLHGGGYCLGGLDTEDFTCRLICHKLGVAVLNVDYRLAPEHPFPAGVCDSYDAVKWVRYSSNVFFKAYLLTVPFDY
jgi:acetyl esterase/lipase